MLLLNVPPQIQIKIYAIIGPEPNNNDVHGCILDFNRKVNVMLAMFKYIPASLRYSLYKTCCMSLYGCVLWDFSFPSVQEYFTSWRKSVRRVWKVPARTHNNLLPLICNDDPVDVQLHKRVLSFFGAASKSSNKCINIACKLAINGSCSSLANSLTVICNKYMLNKGSALLNASLINSYYGDKVTPDVQRNAGTIKDFIQKRDIKIYNPVCHEALSTEEAQDIKNLLCTA